MKKIKFIILALIIMVGSFSLFACGEQENKGGVLSELVISTSSIEMESGESKKINAYSTVGATITFSSADESVATVSEDGTVSAISKGKTNVLITDGEVVRYCVITVWVADYEIKLDCDNITVYVGTYKEIKATIYKNGKLFDDNVQWSATGVGSIVSTNNTATFMSSENGEAVITAKIGNVSKTCTITVVE